MSDTESKILSSAELDELLDQEIMQIEDAPEFKTPPKGKYVLNLKSVERKEDLGEKKRSAISFNYEIKEILELDDASQTAEVKVGDKFSETYFLPKGLSYAKKHLVVLAESFNLTRTSDVMAAAVDIPVGVILKHRKNKDTDNVYPVVEAMQVM